MGNKDSIYFSHDANARHDPKILEMRAKYGAEGYGWFWILVEMMREQRDYRLPCVRNAYAMQLQCDPDAASEFINACINEFKLFASDGKYFWSESLIRRMSWKDEKSVQARQAALSRWEKQRDADAKRAQSKERKVKESKGKENNKPPLMDVREHVSLSDDELNKLVEKHGEDEVNGMLDILDNYKGSSGKKYVSDYRAILSWVVDRYYEKKGGNNNGSHGGIPGKNFDEHAVSELDEFITNNVR